MEGKIPDFGRGTIDQFDQTVKGFFKKKKLQEQQSVNLLHSKDMVDLSGILEAAEPEKKKWTVLLYMDGNNNLYGPMYDAMNSLETVGSNKDVNIVTEIGGNPGEQVHGGLLQQIMDKMSQEKKIQTVKRYYVTKDTSTAPEKINSPELADLGEQDMGDPKVVSDFLEWGIKQYPAEHYAVVFFNHGAGFAGVLSDEKSGNLLDMNELKSVIDNASKVAGQKIDLVDFDACLMAQMEVAHAIKDGAKFMVASEETERGTAQPLDRIMKDLQEGSQEQAMSPEDLAKLFVYESFHQPAANILTATLSAVDLEKIDKVIQSSDKLAQVLIAGTVDPAVIRKNIEKSQNFCQGLNYKLYNDYHDIGHFAQLLKDDPRIKDEEAKKSAENLLNSLQEAVIANEHHGEKYKNSTGLSTYLPANYGYDSVSAKDSVNFSSTHNYDDIPYARDTHWDELIKYIAKDSPWHNFLKTFGLSKDSIDTLDRNMKAVGNKAATITKLILGTGKFGAQYEAYQALKTGVPKSYLWLGSSLSAKLGMLGGGYKVFQGVKGMYDACQKDGAPEGIADVLMSKETKMVNAGFNIAEGAALTAVNAALLMGAAAGITTTAGILAFALPVAKIIYDAIAIPKHMKHQAELMQMENPVDKKTVEEKLKDINDAGGQFAN
ncbi:MAG TPA: clostripain-related cysteine peptidase [Candidatus Eremiobacteraeota bacterium]|nr:MAG: Clostripain precursor [bacterium ADurb.Bin363]HPZ07428.1 clostripain-related cysteine peptidase [Candidatus Eremiobacteraeota bacterium]